MPFQDRETTGISLKLYKLSNRIIILNTRYYTVDWIQSGLVCPEINRFATVTNSKKSNLFYSDDNFILDMEESTFTDDSSTSFQP